MSRTRTTVDDYDQFVGAVVENVTPAPPTTVTWHKFVTTHHTALLVHRGNVVETVSSWAGTGRGCRNAAESAIARHKELGILPGDALMVIVIRRTRSYEVRYLGKEPSPYWYAGCDEENYPKERDVHDTKQRNQTLVSAEIVYRTDREPGETLEACPQSIIDQLED